MRLSQMPVERFVPDAAATVVERGVDGDR